MRTYLVALLCFLPLAAWLQTPITITHNDMPEPGDTLRYSNASPQSIQVSQTGANQVWDYSHLQPYSQDREDYVYALQTVYAFHFFGVNQYGTKIADTIGGGPFVFTDVYNFFRSASGDFRAEGVGFRYQGVPAAAYYSDEDELYQFPLDYQDRDSSTYRFSASLGSGLEFSQQGYRINEVDGWGVIKTPYDSVACLRLVTTTIGVDSMHFNGFRFGFPNQQRSIQFLANGIHIPVLEISGPYQSGFFQPQRVQYRDAFRNLVATAEPRPSGVTFYPNPAQNFLTIRGEAVPMRLLVTDGQGKVMTDTQIVSGMHVHSVEGYASGLYWVQVMDEVGSIVATAKLVVGGR